MLYFWRQRMHLCSAEEELAGLSRSPLPPITPPKQDSDREVADDVSDDDDNDEHGDRVMI